MQNEKECFLCRRLLGEGYELGDRWLEEHHVFPGTSNRKNSEKHGLKVWLCKYHHTGGKHSVHMDKETALIVQKEAQRKFEETHTREEFIKIFGKSRL